jgi:hypothetical protein
VAVIAVAAAVSGIVVLHASSQTVGGVIHHLDGEGPLGSTDDPEARSGFSFDADDPGPWTQGYELCLAQGTKPAIIERISPESVVGSGLTYLGAFVREFPSHAGELPLAGVKGFPPTVSDPLTPAAGYAITMPCVATGEPPVYQELDIGFAKPVGSSGGGWNGIDIAYRVGATQYVVSLNYFVFTCGPRTPAYAGCSGPPGGSPSASNLSSTTGAESSPKISADAAWKETSATSSGTIIGSELTGVDS